MQITVMPKDYIRSVLIDEMSEVAMHHPYMSFSLICSGIEFLGICLDAKSDWFKTGLTSVHFKHAIDNLFPDRYRLIKDRLYLEVRCGMMHSHQSGSFSLAEVRNNPLGT